MSRGADAGRRRRRDRAGRASRRRAVPPRDARGHLRRASPDDGDVARAPIARGAPAVDAPRPAARDLGSGVKGVDLIPGALDAPTARPGDAVRVLLKGRLFAKQGWIFTNDYVEGPGGTPEPRAFVLGAGQVIEGLDIAVRGMREGGVRRVVIPPPVSYRDETQEPIPRDFSNRRRLYTTIFNPTRLANGEGDTLATVIFDVELVRVGGAR